MSPGFRYEDTIEVQTVRTVRSDNLFEIYHSKKTVPSIVSKRNKLQGNGIEGSIYSMVCVIHTATKKSLANIGIGLEKLDEYFESILGSEHSTIDFVYQPYELLNRNSLPYVANIFTKQDFCKNVRSNISRLCSSSWKALENISEELGSLVRIYLSPGYRMSNMFLDQLSKSNYRLNLNMEYEYLSDNNCISQLTRKTIYENLISLVSTFIGNTYYVILNIVGLYKMYKSSVFDEALNNCASKIGLRWTSIHPYNCRYCLQVPVFTNGFIDRQDQKNNPFAHLSSTDDGRDSIVWVNNSHWRGGKIDIWVNVM